MPRLRLQADLHGDLVFARRRQKRLDLAEGPHRIRTRRLQEHLEHARSMPPREFSRFPLRHVVVLVLGSLLDASSTCDGCGNRSGTNWEPTRASRAFGLTREDSFEYLMANDPRRQ